MNHSERAISVLQTPPSERSPEEIENLVSAINHVDFFGKLAVNNPQMQLEYCRLMTLASFDADEFVFRLGDHPAEEIYIILRGKIKVLIPKDDVMTQVAELGIGMTFGEYATIRSEPRKGTVQCIEPCVFGVLSKVDYFNVKQAYEQSPDHA